MILNLSPSESLSLRRMLIFTGMFDSVVALSLMATGRLFTSAISWEVPYAWTHHPPSAGTLHFPDTSNNS